MAKTIKVETILANHPSRNQDIVALASEFDEWEVGEEGVLVSRSPERGKTEWLLQADPPLTNSSREPKVAGWCGTTNNVSITAHGWHRVVKVIGWDHTGGMKVLRVVPVDGTHHPTA